MLMTFLRVAYVVLLSFYIQTGQLIAQKNWELGMTTGVSLTGIQKKFVEHFEDGWGSHSIWENSKPMPSLIVGFYGKLSFKHFSIKSGIQYTELGQQLVVDTELSIGTSIIENHSERLYHLNAIQLPIHIQKKCRIGKIRPFVFVGIVPSLITNSWMRERDVGSDYYYEGDIKGYFQDGFVSTRLRRINLMSQFGFGLNLSQRVNWSIQYGIGFTGILCKDQSRPAMILFDRIYSLCHQKFKNQVLEMNFSYLLFGKVDKQTVLY